MGTATYTDAWSIGQSKPLTEEEANARRAEGEVGDHAHTTTGLDPSSAGGHDLHEASLRDSLAAWAEQALGPAATGIGRELDALAKKLSGPGQLRNPWIWIGAAGLLGYALGRSRALRPIASFTLRTALTTFLERALRA
ncbi:MAG TPA: hypothetical protein VHE35_36615 [Kofleriaceae bacterium]|nr:hypothetical protein [Kofleriaceae bacterium]